jgi:hypothetical protein
VNAVSEVSQELYTSTINEIIKQVPELGSQACEEIIQGSLSSYSGSDSEDVFTTWAVRLARSAWYLEVFVSRHYDAIVAALSSVKTWDPSENSVGQFLLELCESYDQLQAILNSGPVEGLEKRLSAAARDWAKTRRNASISRQKSMISIEQSSDEGDDDDYTLDTLAASGYYEGEGGSVPRRVVPVGRSKKSPFKQLKRDAVRGWLLRLLEPGQKTLDEIKAAGKLYGYGGKVLTTALGNVDFEQIGTTVKLSEFGQHLIRRAREDGNLS